MIKEDAIVMDGEEVRIVAEIWKINSDSWFARGELWSRDEDKSWEGLSRPTRAAAERDRDLLFGVMRQMADDYVAPAPPPMAVTHTIANVGGTARDRWTCGDRRAEARWDADARMWRADVWGADGHECTYWAPSSEDATCAAALLLGEVAS